eukprot:139856-Prorocentrum_minimum.AAC.2
MVSLFVWVFVKVFVQSVPGAYLHHCRESEGRRDVQGGALRSIPRVRIRSPRQEHLRRAPLSQGWPIRWEETKYTFYTA